MASQPRGFLLDERRHSGTYCKSVRSIQHRAAERSARRINLYRQVIKKIRGTGNTELLHLGLESRSLDP